MEGGSPSSPPGEGVGEEGSPLSSMPRETAAANGVPPGAPVQPTGTAPSPDRSVGEAVPRSPRGTTPIKTGGLAREEVSKLLLRKLCGDSVEVFEPLQPIATAANLPAVYQALGVVDTLVQVEVLSMLVVAADHSKVTCTSESGGECRP